MKHAIATCAACGADGTGTDRKPEHLKLITCSTCEGTYCSSPCFSLHRSEEDRTGGESS